MKNIRNMLLDYFCVAIGCFILAFAINFFLVPVKISTGGVSGIATIFYYIFKVPLSVTILLINAVLFVFGYKMLKKTSIIKTLSGILLLSLFLEITKYFGTYTEDVLIASVFGGILVGIGVGLALMKDASTGGSDFAALMLNKIIPHVSVPNFIMIIDSVVIIASGIIFKDYTIMFYSVISLYISNKVTDYMLVKGDAAKSVYIISKKNSEIASEVMTDMERGVTGIYSKGYYNDTDMTMLMCIVRNKEVYKLLEKVKQIDKSAFTIISNVREVHGVGFKEE